MHLMAFMAFILLRCNPPYHHQHHHQPQLTTIVDHQPMTSSVSTPPNHVPLSHKDHIVWIDMEMTGLDPDQDCILELATLITDNELKIIATGPELVIHQPLATLEAMDNWNRDHHRKSGLWNKVLHSATTVGEAEDLTLKFIEKYTITGKNCLAGNSIWQDRRFIIKHMPRIHSHLHYRLIDVSTIKELGKRWYPQIAAPPKKNMHRAMDDIIESIDELKYFKSKIFIAPFCT